LLTAIDVVHVTDMPEQHISAAAVAVDYEVFSPITSPAKKDNEGSQLGQFAGAQSTPAQNPIELKVQLRRLEIEAEMRRLEIERDREREREREEREREEREHRFELEEKRLQLEKEERIQERQNARQHELALKQLELNAQQAIPPRDQTAADAVDYEVFSPITSPAKKDNEGSQLGQFAGAQSTPAHNPNELKIQLRRLEIAAEMRRLEI